jgi:hypothetical protein
LHSPSSLTIRADTKKKKTKSDKKGRRRGVEKRCGKENLNIGSMGRKPSAFLYAECSLQVFAGEKGKHGQKRVAGFCYFLSCWSCVTPKKRGKKAAHMRKLDNFTVQLTKDAAVAP